MRDHLLWEKLRIDIRNNDAGNSSLDRSPERQALVGILQKPDPTFDEALTVYLRERRSELEGLGEGERRKWDVDKKRVIRCLTEALGPGRTVSTLTRDDARTFIAALRQRGLGPASVRLDTAELGTVLELRVNAELSVIARILVFTGARLKEITGLAWDDVKGLDSEQPFLEIRGNAVRGLKTKSSKRTVPILKPAARALREYRRTAQEAQGALSAEGPVFPLRTRRRPHDGLSDPHEGASGGRGDRGA